MPKKLTLSLDQNVIEKAKIFAKKNHTSLSALVEKHFRTLVHKNKNELSPIIEELSGVIDLPENYNEGENYTEFLIEKYK